MLMHKKTYVMTGEMKPDIGTLNVWEYIQEKFDKQETFDILVPEHEHPEYVWMQSIYVMGDYDKGDAVIQCEPVILCFDSQKLYTSQNNSHPEEVWFNKVADIYSFKRLKEVGYVMSNDNIPSSLPTAYSDEI